jgi:hypothetical protein
MDTTMKTACRAMLWSGTICAVLDGLSAIVRSALLGAPPIRVFQGVASGFFGSRAFSGGTSTALAGLAVHVFVAFAAAAVYVAASRIAPSLNDHPVLSGVAYGVGVHLFMTFIVIPASAIGARPIVWSNFAAVLLIHMTVVGPSIAVTTARMMRVSLHERHGRNRLTFRRAADDAS